VLDGPSQGAAVMGRRAPRRDVFRYTSLLRSLVGLSLLIGLAGLGYEIRKSPDERSRFNLFGFLGFSALSTVGVCGTLRGRIELREREVRVVELVGHRSYPRDRVIDVSFAKGCPVSLKLNDGSWVNLPDTGHSSRKVAGAVRAWLNET